MNATVHTLIAQGDRLFDNRSELLSLYQEIAENFYPERADFTAGRNIGSGYFDHMTTGYPVKASRDLTNIITTMMRPRDVDWFKATVKGYDDLDDAGKFWLERATRIMKNSFYSGRSGFSRATSETDADISNFGQGVFSCEYDWENVELLWRNWHTRDVVWQDDFRGRVSRVDRKWTEATAEILNKFFKGKVHENVKKALEKDPSKTFDVRHTMVLAEDYNTGKNWEHDWVSVYYDVDNKFVLEEVSVKDNIYRIPRWKTISGSQYAYSPATMAALPDARMLQDIALVMIEASQKSVDPPMIAIEDVLRSDANLFAGGITNVESEYDERLGSPLRPVGASGQGIAVGLELINSVQEAMADSFFLNKIGLPPLGGGMSPLEVSQRIQEYVMAGLPLFEPLEDEYNVQLCDLGFNTILNAGGFGPIEEMPESLSGQDIVFTFQNPLRSAADKAKGQMFLEAKGVIAQTADIDPSVAGILDYELIARDVIEGIGVPRAWFTSEEELAKNKEASDQKAESDQLLQGIAQGAEAAQSIGDAGQSLQALGVDPSSLGV